MAKANSLKIYNPSLKAWVISLQIALVEGLNFKIVFEKPIGLKC